MKNKKNKNNHLFLKSRNFLEIITSAIYRTCAILLCVGVPVSIKNSDKEHIFLYLGIAMVGVLFFATRFQLYELRKERLYEKYKRNFATIMGTTKLDATKKGKVRKSKKYSA